MNIQEKLKKILTKASNLEKGKYLFISFSCIFIRVLAFCIMSVYSFFKRPTPVNSIKNNRWFKTVQNRPFSNGFSLVQVVKFSYISFIKILYRISSPSTIFSRIVPERINPVNSSLSFSMNFHMGDVRFIHIIEKFFERNPLAFYPNPAVIRKTWVSRIRASLYDTVPFLLKVVLLRPCFVYFCIKFLTKRGYTLGRM